MISGLNKSEFIKRLEENTKIGDPSIMGTPFAIFAIFGNTKKKFYGEFNDSKFRLTKNSVFFPIPYVFEGKLKPKHNSSTEIILKIRPIWFGYLWIRILPVLALIFINVFLLLQDITIETNIYVFVNIFIVFMFTPIALTINLKKRLLKDLYEIFEIND